MPLLKRETVGYYDRPWAINTFTNGTRLGIYEKMPNIDTKLQPNSQSYKMLGPQLQAVSSHLVDRVTKIHHAGPYSEQQKSQLLHELTKISKNGENDTNHTNGTKGQKHTQLHTSPLFVVPKPGKNKWRVIFDAKFKKYPSLYSINDLIPDSEAYVQYVTLKEIIKMLHAAGKGAYIWVLDLLDAFYAVGVDKRDWQYLGVSWMGSYYISTVLLMGLRSAPRIYTRFVDTIEYIIVNNNKNIAFINAIQLIRHYMDDFFGVHSDKNKAITQFNQAKYWMEQLNVPFNPKKAHPPEQSRKILGYIFDTRVQKIALCEQKRYKALLYITTVFENKGMYKKQGEKLMGILSTVAQLLHPGRAFLRRLQSFISDPKLSDWDWIQLNQFLKEDLNVWYHLLCKKQNFQIPFEWILMNPSESTNVIHTDASGIIGVGGTIIHGATRRKFAFQKLWAHTFWYQLTLHRTGLDIHVQELLGALIAFELFKNLLKNSTVVVYNDNPSAAQALITKAPKLHRSDLQYLTREIATIAMKFNIKFWGIKIDGKHNDHADALSRYKPYNWAHLGYKIVDPTHVIQKHLLKLKNYYPNREATDWAWTEEQRQQLKIAQTEQMIDKHLTKMAKPKGEPPRHNILTRTRFDTWVDKTTHLPDYDV